MCLFLNKIGLTCWKRYPQKTSRFQVIPAPSMLFSGVTFRITQVTLSMSRSKGPGRAAAALCGGKSLHNNATSCQLSRTFPLSKRMAKIKKGCVDDLATLSELNEDIILEELQARYNQDVIYVRKYYV